MQDDYFKIPAISATALKAGATSMLHMRHMMTTRGKEQSAAMRFGTLVHLCALEPAVALETVRVYEGRKVGKDWEAFELANEGKHIVSRDEYSDLERVLASVQSNKHAARLLRGVKTEVPMTWTTKHYGEAKAKVDAIGANYMIEVKTTRAIALDGFERQCYQLGYHLQLGWYAEGMDALGMPRSNSFVIAIENVAPFDVAVYQADEDMIAAGRRAAVELAKQYRAAEKAGRFEGVAGGEMRVLSLPAYAQEKEAMQPTESMEASEL